MKRFGLRGRARYYGAGLATVAFFALTMFVVLPAFASNTGDEVNPPSSQGVMPVDVGVGGNQSCSSAGLFPGMSGALETTDPSPPSPGVTVSWPSGQGWNFTLTSGALPGFENNPNKGGSLSVDSNGNAAILGIAIKGGTDNLAYDYRPTQQGWVAKDSNLHAPAAAGKFTVSGGIENKITQYYGISQLVICYKTPLATVSGNAYKAAPGNPIAGLTVTLKDTTNPGTQTTTTDAGGNYSFSAIPGDHYTVCISNPANLASGAFKNVQSLPATDAGSCQPTTGTNGYSITGLTSTNGVGLNFGFQPYGTLSGTVYTDVNGPKGAGPDGVFESGTDTPLQGWTVNLYDGGGNQVGQGTSDQSGKYSISAPYGTYTACVTPGSAGSYAQTEPRPTAANSCTSLSGLVLPKGQPVQLASTASANFGVDPSVAEPTPCPPQVPFGANQTNGELQIQLAGCKPFQTFVFGNGTLPDNSMWASVFAADQVVTLANPEVPMIEKWVFPDPIKADGTPTYTHVDYTDVFPYDPAAAQELPQCKLDPRDPSDPNGMTLTPFFQQDANKGLVLPAHNPNGTTATSCAISTRIYVDAAGDTRLEVYAYSDIDSWGKSGG